MKNAIAAMQADVSEEREADVHGSALQSKPAKTPARRGLPALTAATWKTKPSELDRAPCAPSEAHLRARRESSAHGCARPRLDRVWSVIVRLARDLDRAAWRAGRMHERDATPRSPSDDRSARRAELLAGDEVVAGEVLALFFADVEGTRRGQVRDVEHRSCPRGPSPRPRTCAISTSSGLTSGPLLMSVYVYVPGGSVVRHAHRVVRERVRAREPAAAQRIGQRAANGLARRGERQQVRSRERVRTRRRTPCASTSRADLPAGRRHRCGVRRGASCARRARARCCVAPIWIWSPA